MNLLFVYPVGTDFVNIQKRYQGYSRVLYQRNQILCNLIDARRFLDRNNSSKSVCDDADAIIIHIAIIPFAAKEIQHWKARDKTILVDLSSPVYEDPEIRKIVIGHKETNDHSGKSSEGLFVDKEQLLWPIKLADGMITNSQTMQREWNGVIQTRYIPDYVDLDSRLIHPKDEADSMRIGIIISDGGFQKMIDSGVHTALEKILSHNPKTKAIVFGEHPHMAHVLKVPPPQKLFIPLIERDQWSSLLQLIDVCILPYTDDYDIRCGRIDILELMSMRIPWAASECEHILPLQRYGWVVQNDPEIWNRILGDMVHHLGNYHEELSESYLYALSQGLEENAYHLFEYLVEVIKKVRNGAHKE